jgi:pimeloyl-ACP methyl ester carboxylesterase
MSHTVYQSADVDGVSVFYREAGPPDRPTILLLHGFPSSSRMWEPLLTRLADAFHLIAPDYPGFGHSDAPDPVGFAYTFDHLAEIIGRFTEQLGLGRYTLFMQDYGGPVGFRLATAHPARVRAMIVQNAVAHEDGLGPLWDTRRAFWADRAAHETALRENFFSPAATRQRHVGSSPVPQQYDPDLWTDELAFLGRPGQHDLQTDLFYDYRTNVASYPAWQQWLRSHQPPLLVLWGRYDPSFLVAEAEAYRRDVPGAEVHLLDAGHFALDEQPDQIADLTRRFLRLLEAHVPGQGHPAQQRQRHRDHPEGDGQPGPHQGVVVVPELRDRGPSGREPDERKHRRPVGDARGQHGGGDQRDRRLQEHHPGEHADPGAADPEQGERALALDQATADRDRQAAAGHDQRERHRRVDQVLQRVRPLGADLQRLAERPRRRRRLPRAAGDLRRRVDRQVGADPL